jgi:hypothetical protein
MKPILPRVSVLLVSVLAWGAAAGARADSVTQRWAIAPDERPYVTTGNLERGIGYNPVTKNVLLVGRFGGPKVYVLNSADGGDGSADTGEPRVLSLIDEAGEGLLVGGTFTLNLVGGAEDGAVYACNLATSLGTVRIYRWANDQPDTPVSVAYSGDPLGGIATPGTGQDIRFGDNFAVRGSGTGTQLIQVARNGKYVLIYTTTDGLTFTPKVFTSPALQGKGGLGVAFGEGNTFWSKLNGVALQRAQFDLGTGQLRALGEVATNVIAAGVTGLAVDPVARRLAAVDYAAHTLAVYDISDPAGPIPIGDPLSFPAANANANGTTCASFGGEDVFALDTNNGVLAARVEESVVADPSVIVIRQVFYNESFFDGGNAGAGAGPADDAAIASDKTALLPGAKATFAQYTSYLRGLNGIMVDLEGLPGDPTAADFEFRAGNTATPAEWPAAAAPASVTVRRGAGLGGSDRVTLIWGADAVKGSWLQITVLPTLATGLAQPDVFYFGNAVGETGNSATDARVTATDALRVLSNLSTGAGVTNRFDINRDGRIGAADRLGVLGNISALDPLILLNLGGGGALQSRSRAIASGPRLTTSMTSAGIGAGRLRLQWISDGAPATLWTTEFLTASNWEIFQEFQLSGTGFAGTPVDVLVHIDPEGPARFYRLESGSAR